MDSLLRSRLSNLHQPSRLLYKIVGVACILSLGLLGGQLQAATTLVVLNGVLDHGPDDFIMPGTGIPTEWSLTIPVSDTPFNSDQVESSESFYFQGGGEPTAYLTLGGETRPVGASLELTGGTDQDLRLQILVVQFFGSRPLSIDGRIAWPNSVVGAVPNSYTDALLGLPALNLATSSSFFVDLRVSFNSQVRDIFAAGPISQFTVIPEPSGACLLGFCGAWALVSRKRKAL